MISFELPTVQIACFAIAVVTFLAYVVYDGMARLNGAESVQDDDGGNSNIVHRNDFANVQDWLLGDGRTHA